MCDSRSNNGRRGRPYHRGNLPTLFADQKCVVLCFFFLHPLPRVQCGGKNKGDKANGLSALFNMTWSSELRHELDTASIMTSFLKNLVVCPVNVWNCEVGHSIQATLFSLIFSHNHFHWSPPSVANLFVKTLFPTSWVCQQKTMHSTLSVLEASHLAFKQVWY